jgi:tetratricopeptide (TPR) repeat protein
MITSSLFARRLLRPAVLALAVSASALLPTVYAQLPPATPPVTASDAKEFEAADALLAAGKWKDALQAFEAFRNKYKNQSPKSVDAKYRLGIVYIHEKMFDDAARELRQLLVDPKMDPRGKEEVQLLIAKALTLKGVNLPSDGQIQKGAQNKAFEDAIAEYDKFLAEFPKTKSGDSAHYLRAILLMAIEHYDEAVKGFATVVTSFPQSPLRFPSQMNIGKARMNQAYALLATKEGKEPKPEDVTAARGIFTAQALPALQEAYSKSGDLAIMNEAVFYVGQILLTLQQSAPPSEDPAIKKQQETLLLNALDSFRAVRSREEVVAAQEAKIEAFKKQIQLLTPGTPEYSGNKAALENLITIDEEKKQKFLDEQDQFLGARLAIARIFLIQKKFDECRVLIRYLQGQKELLEKEKDARANLANFLAVTYIEQKNLAKGDEAAEAFRREFNTTPGMGHEAGEGLPLVLSAAYIENPTEANVARAAAILDQARKDYATWRYEGQSLQVQIGLLIGQEKYAEALVLVDKMLGANPRPEVEVDMLMTKAGVLRSMGQKLSLPAKADEAALTYKVVMDKFPALPQAEEAQYEAASILETRNPTAALAALQKFIDKFKDTAGKNEKTAKNVPLAQFLLGRVHQTANKPDDAIKAYRYLAEKWPESEPAPKSFFKVFDIQMERKNYTEAAKTMETYLQKYPTHEYLYYAYNNLAELLFSGYLRPPAKPGQPAGPTDADLEAGTKKLTEYVDYELSKDLKEKEGAKTLLKISDRWKKTVPAGLPYISFNSAQKLTWQKAMDNILSSNERILKSYLNKPEEVLKALNNLVFAQKEMVKARVIDSTKAEAYFTKLIEQYGAAPEVKSKIEFSIADLLKESSPEKANHWRKTAMDTAAKATPGPVNPKGPDAPPAPPKPSFTPEQYDSYIAGLFDQKQYDEMTKSIAKMRLEYPLQKDETPEKAPRPVQEAQANALFWEAKILGAQGKTTDAGSKYQQLAKEYSHSGKVLEADFGIILGKMDMNPPQIEPNFIDRLRAVVLSPQTAKFFELRARALVLSGRVLEAQKEYDEAIKSYRQVPLLFQSVPAVASEGLWRAGQILKGQATGQLPVETNAEKKEKALTRAKLAVEKKLKDDADKKATDEADKKKGGGDKAKGEAKPGEAKAGAAAKPDAAKPDAAKPDAAKPDAAKVDEKSAAKPDAEKK